MDHETSRLKRELARVEKGRGKRYPAELRVRVVRWAQRRRAAGASWQQLKRELGQRFDTVRRWCTTSKTPTTRVLLTVSVVTEQSSARSVALVSPSGFRLEGITLAEAAALLREFG